MKIFQDFYLYSSSVLQTVEGQNGSFSAASKGYKRTQTMNLVMSYLAKQSVIGIKKKMDML